MVLKVEEAQVKTHSIYLKIVLILTQDRCTIYAKHTQKSFWMHLIILLGDVAHVEVRFGPFGDSAHLDTRLVHVLRRTYHKLGNQFGRTQWNC
jgi:hypothetical protein